MGVAKKTTVLVFSCGVIIFSKTFILLCNTDTYDHREQELLYRMSPNNKRYRQRFYKTSSQVTLCRKSVGNFVVVGWGRGWGREGMFIVETYSSYPETAPCTS